MNAASSESTVARQAVERFYELVLQDDQLAPYFVGADLRRLKRYLSELLTLALAGTEPHWPKELVAAHQGMGLSDDDFDRIGHYLLTTLLRMRVGPDALVRVGGVLTGVREPILRRAGRLARSA
ncbi:MAG TPA: group 1 truncated hemoglobin [Rugosimonospora sp.]|nr:group 1 truncated hemoglobin [Rugosimonospora sp.]